MNELKKSRERKDYPCQKSCSRCLFLSNIIAPSPITIATTINISDRQTSAEVLR